jgi:DNA-binding beta-propeller fold protein YncE
MHRSFRRLWPLLAAFLGVSAALADPQSFLQLQQDVPLPGDTSRFDYQSYDEQAGLLYISHMGQGQIILFNTQKASVQTVLSGFPGVTGLLVVPEIHRLFASVTGRHEVDVVDTQTLKTLARIPAGNFPDGMAYDPDLRRVFVSDEKGGEVIVLDAIKAKRLAYIKLEGEVGNVSYDPQDHRLFANIQTRNEIAVVNPGTGKNLLRYTLQEGRHPHGLCLDPNSRLAFIGCDGDAKLVVVDIDKFDEIGVSDVGKGPDVLAFDPQLGYLYVASEAGTVSVFRVRDRKVEKIGDFPVGTNAHSVAVDPKTHFVYFPLRMEGAGPVLRIMKPAN